MILLTLIARQQDGLPLAASVQEDEQAGRSITDYQTKAKQLFKLIAANPNPPPRFSLDADPYIYHYVLERGVCCLVLCDKAFSKRLAFSYLESLHSEFHIQYGTRVNTVSRPYCFIEFDTYMQKQRKSYLDSRARRTLAHVSTELHDVQRIMVQNIDDMLRRGEFLTNLDDKADKLASMSQKYKKDAMYLNLHSSYTKVGFFVVIIVLLVFLFRYFIF